MVAGSPHTEKAQQRQQQQQQVFLAVPRNLVKTVKEALHSRQRLDKSGKIRKLISGGGGAAAAAAAAEEEQDDDNNVVVPLGMDAKSYDGERYLIPTTVRVETGASELEILAIKTELLDMVDFNQDRHSTSIGIYLRSVSLSDGPALAHLVEPPRTTSLLGQVITAWLLSLPSSLLPLPVSTLVSISSWPYIIYPPLLLLPQTTFTTPPWPPDIFSTILSPYLPGLYTLLCTHMKVTHIALNAPIPARSPGTPNNILRKPHNLTPLHGSFGPSLSPTHVPSCADFAAAFWCTVRQNGIFQTWAPRHTMFSRGNISEKARLLGLKTLTAEGLGGDGPGASSAVDLYAGIGYFAFCYAKLGISKILCWELSGWSVEGLRRGAVENGWGAIKVLDLDNNNNNKDNESNLIKHNEEEKFLVFQENNQNATQCITALRSQIPPIRHVNCGFLPTSQASWETAVRALDPDLGGWIHAHENIKMGMFERRREEVLSEFRELARRWRWRWRRRRGGDESRSGEQSSSSEEEEEEKTSEEDSDSLIRREGREEREGRDSVECVHFEQVKSYAPGVMHYVLDIGILPIYTQ